MRNKVLNEIRKLIGHKNVEVLNRGNSAILIALMELSKSGKRVLIPEEGGWLTYSKYAENLGKEVVRVNCVDGVIDLNDLAEKACEGDVLIYHSLGGYFAANDVVGIYNTCSKVSCKVIVDVCGSIGTDLIGKDVNNDVVGDYADMIVCSFGYWKLIDYGWRCFS